MLVLGVLNDSKHICISILVALLQKKKKNLYILLFITILVILQEFNLKETSLLQFEKYQVCIEQEKETTDRSKRERIEKKTYQTFYLTCENDGRHVKPILTVRVQYERLS